MVKAYVGKGCTVSIMTDSDIPTSLGDAAFGDVVSFDIPSASADSVQVTPLNATAHEHLAGLVDYGEFSFSVNLNPAGGYPDIGGKYSFTITFSDSSSTQWAFDGFVTGFDGGVGGVDEAITASVSVKVTGAVTVT